MPLAAFMKMRKIFCPHYKIFCKILKIFRINAGKQASNEMGVSQLSGISIKLLKIFRQLKDHSSLSNL